MDILPLPEIMSDTSDEALVDSILRRIDPELRIGDADRSEVLGLTRWTVTAGLEMVVERLRREDPSLPGPAQSQLDVLLAVVRRRAREQAGRSVVVERDRDITVHDPNPHVKVADIDPPVLVAPQPTERVPPGNPERPLVAVADAQVGQHEDLAGRVLAWRDPQGPPRPRALAHAAFVTGTVLKHAQDARLLCRPVLVHGDGVNRSWNVAERLMAFAGEDVAVLNMSFGCQTDTDEPPFSLARAIGRLAARTVLVAAGGNTPDHKPIYPAALDGVLGVGAVHKDGSPDPEKTPVGSWVDVRAPGIDVVGPVPRDPQQLDGDSGYARWSGSSFACAYVTGEIARLVSGGMDRFAARDWVLAGHVDRVSPTPHP